LDSSPSGAEELRQAARPARLAQSAPARRYNDRHKPARPRGRAMLRFRPSLPPQPTPVTDEGVRRLAEGALAPPQFFTAFPPVRLEFEHAAVQETPWEVFRGRLLDPAHTRQSRTFEAWDVYLVDEAGRSGQPLLSLKYDRAARQL